MKTMKKLLGGVLVFVMLLSLLPAPVTNAAKEKNDTIPTKVRSYTDSETSFDFMLKDGVTVKSVTSSNKKLLYKITHYSITNDKTGENNYTITVLGLKNGTYTLTIKLSNKKSKKVTVYNYPSPLKMYKINGKKYGYLNNTNKKSAKVSVTLQKGYTLKKLQYNKTYKVKNDNGYSTDEKMITFKNGGTVKLNQLPYSYKSTYKYETMESENFSEGTSAYTYVCVTYKDKYTKGTETINIGIANKRCF